MSNKGVFNTIYNAFATIFFIKYILPVLIMLIIIIVCITKFNSNKIAKQYEPNSVIMKSNLGREIVEIANETYDRNEVSLEIKRFEDIVYDVELNYTMINKDYTIEQYNNIIKNEITKFYEKVRYKNVVEDRLFADKDEIINEKIHFHFTLDGSYNTYLFSDTLQYDSINKWEKSYNSLITKQYISEETLSKAKAYLLSK